MADENQRAPRLGRPARGDLGGLGREAPALSRHRLADSRPGLALRLRDRGGWAQVHLLLLGRALGDRGAGMEARCRARARLSRGHRGLVARDGGTPQRVLPGRRVRLHDPQPALRRPGSRQIPVRLPRAANCRARGVARQLQRFAHGTRHSRRRAPLDGFANLCTRDPDARRAATAWTACCEPGRTVSPGS